MKIPDHLPWKSTGKTLGSGGQGNVELVVHKGDPNGRLYALKALRRVESPQARQRFRSEIEAVKSLTHEAIVPVVDQSEPDDDFQFYVMEYVDGALPLDRIIFGGSNSYGADTLKCLDLFEQVVSAIQACERSNPRIVHRDIKPNNILIVPDGSIRLIDFGICQIQDGAMVTLVDENVGARNYTSPECEAGNDGQVGIHSDIYSTGKVLWSAITSQSAFAREAAVFGNRSMQTLFPNQPDTWHLTHIFEKTIRENPSDRFQSAQQLLHEVAELRRIISQGFPPIEQVALRCPSCGLERMNWVGRLDPDIFATQGGMDVGWTCCAFCGYIVARDFAVLRSHIERTQNLN
ncbi:MAG: serine/threonine-protein kinase [Chloroflexi bacterium]|nr:serine/threonine-protein kinase [Chloroflexota bacterium]